MSIFSGATKGITNFCFLYVFVKGTKRFLKHMVNFERFVSLTSNSTTEYTTGVFNYQRYEDCKSNINIEAVL